MPLVVVNEGRRRATVRAAENASVVAALGAFVHFYIVCLFTLFCVGTYFFIRMLGVWDLRLILMGCLNGKRHKRDVVYL